MKTATAIWAVVVLLVFAGRVMGQAKPFEWGAGTPESVGMVGAKLDAMKKSLEARKTKALLVIRDDKVVLEWYSADHSATARHYMASSSKGLVGGVSLAVAMSDGKISLDDPASKYIPQWKKDAKKSKITIRQLGSHTSGVEDAEVEGVRHEALTGWKGDFWKRLDAPKDPFTISRDLASVMFEPGSKFDYSNPGIAMMSYAVTAAIKDGEHKDIRTLLRERVMRPIGAGDYDWTVGYGRMTHTVEGLPLVGSWGGANFTARASARVARLMMREGDWEGKRVLSADAVRQITSDAGTPGNCGIGWWSNNQGRYEKLPKDAFWASGAGHQIVLVVPSLKLIVVRNGDEMGPVKRDPANYHEPVRQFLFEPLMGAIK
jgi:CubicO group peptidase (beta-lactamase class C family)